MTKATAWTTLIYGILLIVLGYVGYVQAHSVASLRMGVLFGVLIGVSALGMFKKKIGGLYGAVAFTFIICATFAFRYSYTGKMVPGVLAVLSGGMLLFLLTKLGKWKKGQI